MMRDTASLEGALLDAAVAKAMGARWRISDVETGAPLCLAQGAPGGPDHGPNWKSEVPFCPSSEWDDGGPIIHGERIHLNPLENDERDWEGFIHGRAYDGPTPLIAAMRAFVASKLGTTVDLP